MARPTQRVAPLTPAQLRRLQTLWHRWTLSLGLSREADRRLRHYYVALFSGGRAQQTRELKRDDAARVISGLERLTSRATPTEKQAAGTAGRQGFPERRRVRPNVAAWRALWGIASALGMTRQQLERFIARHYAAQGLHGIADLRTMADLNRVLWGLKAMLRRRPRGTPAARRLEKRAA